MKKILIFFLSVTMGVAAYAQERDTLTVFSPEETAAELSKPEKYPLNWFEILHGIWTCWPSRYGIFRFY